MKSKRSSSAQLKSVRVRLSDARGLLEHQREDQTQAQERHTKTLAEVKRLVHELRQLTAPSADPVVSEHALLRYVERVMGVDLAAVRGAILTDSVRSGIKVMKSGEFPADGFRVRVKKGVVITILADR